MHIRTFRPEDADQIARLFHDTVRTVNRQDYSESQVTAWAPDDIYFRDWSGACAQRYTFVADDSGTIAGFADLEAGGQIGCFYCHRNYQRRGVGTRLYNALETKVHALRLKRLYTEASLTARAFFLRMGFTEVERQHVQCRGERMLNYKMQKTLG